MDLSGGKQVKEARAQAWTKTLTDTPFITFGMRVPPVASSHFVLGSAPGMAVPTCVLSSDECGEGVTINIDAANKCDAKGGAGVLEPWKVRGGTVVCCKEEDDLEIPRWMQIMDDDPIGCSDTRITKINRGKVRP